MPAATAPPALHHRSAVALRLALALLLLLAPRATAQVPPPPPAAMPGTRPMLKVDLQPRIGAPAPLDAAFRLESGQPTTLGQLLRPGRPVVLVLAYYECPMLCTLVLNALAESAQRLPFKAGEAFDVVIVSIDPAETPELAAAKKRNYAQQHPAAGVDQGWRFLTGNEDQIRRVADAVGFRYTYDDKTRQYAHPAGLVILTPQGAVSRYFFGSIFPPRDLRLALVEASQERLGSVTDRVLLICYHYDPMTGRYGPSAMAALRVGAVATVLALGGFIFWALRRERRRPAEVAL